jgi:hypothetical protein
VPLHVALVRFGRRAAYPSTAALGDLEFRQRLTRVALLLAATPWRSGVGFTLGGVSAAA